MSVEHFPESFEAGRLALVDHKVLLFEFSVG
jgi:hypothetical protein